MNHRVSGETPVENLTLTMPNFEESNNLNSSLFVDFENYEDDFSESKNGHTISEQSVKQNVLPWDTFKKVPTKKESASMQNNEWLSFVMRIIKFLMYSIIFIIILSCSLIAKCAVLFAVSQLDEEHTTQLCDYYSDFKEDLNAKISREGRTIWTWCIIFMFLVPECFSILQSIWYSIFKKNEKMPKTQNLAIFLALETLHPIGFALLLFYSLPRINSIEAAAICSCMSFVPVLISKSKRSSYSSNLYYNFKMHTSCITDLLSQNQKYTGTSKMFILVISCNILALLAQGSGLVLPFFIHRNTNGTPTWVLPVSLLLSSCRWWLNYVSDHSYCGLIKFLAAVRTDLENSRHLLQGYIAFWRCLIFISSALVISIFKGIQFREFFKFLGMSQYNVELAFSNSSFVGNTLNTVFYFGDNEFQQEDPYTLTVNALAPLYTFLIQTFCGFLVYRVAIFAYKTQMHKFGVALPISLVTPGTTLLIIMFCIVRNGDSCVFRDFLSDYLFFKEPMSYNDIKDFILSWHIWCWIIWWLSQIWISLQLWFNQKEKLAPVEKIFYNSTYDSLMIDQFIGLNKRKYQIYDAVKNEEHFDLTMQFKADHIQEMERSSNSDSGFSEENTNKKNACATQIYACVTMWHENKEEMMALIGSILRLDTDQCAMRVTQKYYKIFIKDYYELDTHICFDDAFCCMHGCIGPCNHLEHETQINKYVTTFLETMEEAVKNLGMCPISPTKYPTPYGGQLIWTLPGKTRLTVHLKDKNRIRHRKRWSQVMYMYYLLGYRLMDPSIDVDRKELITENTYILTLDGDVDFRPVTVKALIDLMKKDKTLGAACGRIHPVGQGPMIWFQKFEYAIGHWLQKSTEHTTGSVLCSPGCFSLFRAKALMQRNVIAKYATRSTEPKHYIQYDQGEDRWLCTLLLQAGCRVDYCAAGDAYTHAPETFKEFYSQRRRWIPSTMANIFDLLNTSKETRKLNSNISWLYVVYQWILTGSTIIGPSFIYLMMAGAFVTSFHIDNWTSFSLNLIPIIVFLIVCFFCEDRIQLIVAEIITILYSLVMIVVLVGILLEVAAEGSFAPNTLLFFIVISHFVLTGFMHPHEISCLNSGIIYYITVPSMYMLLIIYSIFNIHNVTWGTRESKQQIKSSEETNDSQLRQNDKFRNNWTKPFVNSFKYDFCRNNSKKQEEYLQSIYNAINEINIRLEKIESNHRIGNISKDNAEVSSDNETSTHDDKNDHAIKDELYANADLESTNSIQSYNSVYNEHTNYLISPRWLQSKHMEHGNVDFLSISEEEFWKQLIAKYLHPIENNVDEQKKIAKGLINIRNECLLKFFTLNTLFVVAIFLLQINKDVLHFQWPFSVKYNITFDDVREEMHIKRTYMHLEPIGCLFIIAFVIILFIQFLAMLVHRFDTFTHIIANVKLNCGKKKDLSDDSIATKHIGDIVDGLQNAVENETIHTMANTRMSYSGTQRTVQELMEDVQNPPEMSRNFEVLFQRQLKQSAESGLSKVISSNVPKDVIEAFEKRRSRIVRGQRKRFARNTTTDNSENDERPNCDIKDIDKALGNHDYDNPAYLNDKED
ncbi:chitin synthase chs-2 isoform X3 [Lasioglossum baleicum]|uniref:chitin synthase chs-2 isoform X3 n=1 Tax=Lasioglossum baleicum TaxID=434251 RepID=UPI003FCC7CB6